MGAKRTITVECEGQLEKKVGPGNNTGRVYTPEGWVGRKVLILLLPEED